jgi:proteasome lid subunit RPN8/RPN11
MTKYEKLLLDMGTHSIAEVPREACGIITLSFEYIPCRNLSNTPKTAFIVDPLSILKYKDNIWGFFHSHPGSSDPIPSSRDASSALFSEYAFIVGFSTNFYKYWLRDNTLCFERLNENHLVLC